jgi:Holliday junction resolvase
MGKYIFIKEAKYISDYKIYLKFNDGKEKLLDFENFISGSIHADIKKYQNKNLFKHFTLQHGDLEWNDYELAFPIYDLYQGRI